MKRIFPLLILMLTLSELSSGKGSYAITEADRLYKQFDFRKAVLYYEKALKKDTENPYLMQRIADSYRLLNNWPAAEPYYARLAASTPASPANKLYYAEALRASKKYPQAKIYYGQYLETHPGDSSVKERFRGMDEVNELAVDKGLYQIKNLDSINTKFSEFGVTMHGKNEIYFCSDRKPDVYVRRKDNWTNGTFYAIYKAQVKDSLGNSGNAKLLEGAEVNKKFHQSSPCYNEKLNELYFDRSNFNGRRAFKSADNTVKLKIYKVGWKESAKKWNVDLKEAVAFDNKEYSVCHPALNKNGDTLFFDSDMPGGYGRTDIYMCIREASGSWSAPVNLGVGINTSGDDMFPFIADDGTLYFASNGHVGLGGLDIYSSKYASGNWSPPKNLGTPINSVADDFDYVPRSDNQSGYFCSNRAGGAGDDDIYSFLRKGVVLKGITFDARTGDPIEAALVTVTPSTDPDTMITAMGGGFTCSVRPNTDYVFKAVKQGYYPATFNYHLPETPDLVRIPMYAIGDIKLEVTVIDKNTRELLQDAGVKVTNLHLSQNKVLRTDQNGKCMTAVEASTDYRIEAWKETGPAQEKYLTASAELSTKLIDSTGLIKQLIELERSEGKLSLKNIYYDLDKWAIRPDAASELDKLVRIMKDNRSIYIELGSHTDCRETEEYNMQLSQRRAKSAVDYIVSRGISVRRMVAVGYGKTRLVNNCNCQVGEVPCTEEQHQQNRRTEFMVAKKLLTVLSGK